MIQLSDKRVHEIFEDMANGYVGASREETMSIAHELLQARQTIALHADVCAKLNARIDALEEMKRELMRELAERGVHR